MLVQPPHARQFSGLLAAIGASFCLGIITPGARIAYDSGTSAMTLIAFRVAVAIAATGICLAILRRPWTFNTEASVPIIITTLGILMVAFGYMSSVLFIPVSLSALIFFSFPIIVLVQSILGGRLKPSLATGLIFLVAFAGLTLALGPSFSSLDWRGISCALVAAVGACLVMIAGASAARQMDALTLTFYTQMFCIPIVFSALLGFGTIKLPVDPVGWLGLSMATAGYIFGMCLLMVAVRFVEPVAVSMINNLEPIVTLIAAALLLNEYMSALQYTGGVLVLAAISLATWKMRPRVNMTASK